LDLIKLEMSLVKRGSGPLLAQSAVHCALIFSRYDDPQGHVVVAGPRSSWPQPTAHRFSSVMLMQQQQHRLVPLLGVATGTPDRSGSPASSTLSVLTTTAKAGAGKKKRKV
jgi:hypothetical protein